MSRRTEVIGIALAALFGARRAAAEIPDERAAPSVVALSSGQAEPPARPPRFALPFQLRPAIAKSLLRSDVMASTHAAGATLASVTTAAFLLAPNVAALVRLPYVSNTPIKGPPGSGFANPFVGGLYTPALRRTTRLAAFAGVAIPVGAGGGNAPDKATAAATSAGVYGRAAMDNALWAVDYAVGVVGVGVAEAMGRCTVQGEMTVLELVRTRGERVQKDATRTNLTAGAFAGCYVLPPLQLVGELHYQRWLSTPNAVTIDRSKRDQATGGIGVRFDVAAGPITLRPGLLLQAPLDDPMRKTGYRQVMLDLPVVF